MFCAACYFLCWRLWVRLLLPKCLCEIISESYICIIYNLSDNQNIQCSANDCTKFSNTLLQHNIITQRSAIYYFDRVLHASCDVRTSSLLLFEIIREIWTLLHETKLKIVRGSPSETQCPAYVPGNVFFPVPKRACISRSCIVLLTLFSPERCLIRVYWWIYGQLWIFAWRNCFNTGIQQLPRRLFGSFCIIQFIRWNQSIFSRMEDINSL